MTERDWLASEDPAAMLRLLTPRLVQAESVGSHVMQARFPTSDRKLRLFACACARQWVIPMPEDDLRQIQAVESLEGDVCDADYLAINSLLIGPPSRWAMHWAQRPDHGNERKADLLREIIGNPFRAVEVVKREDIGDGRFHFQKLDGGLVSIGVRMFDAAWLTWNDGVVVRLARAAYEERPTGCVRCDGTGRLTNPAVPRGWQMCPHCQGQCVGDGTLDPARLAVLADALEEAGCQDLVILCHLRGLEPRDDLPSLYGERYWKPLRGPHVRGCWVLDLLLGRS